MSAKHHHFAAAAQYRAACDCLEKRKYGEEIARLKDAVACAVEGIKEARSGGLNKTVMDDLNGLKRKVEEDLKRAEKDNDIIYLSMFSHLQFNSANVPSRCTTQVRTQDSRACQHGCRQGAASGRQPV